MVLRTYCANHRLLDGLLHSPPISLWFIRVGLGICISNKFPGDVDAAGLGTTLGEPLYQTQPWVFHVGDISFTVEDRLRVFAVMRLMIAELGFDFEFDLSKGDIFPQAAWFLSPSNCLQIKYLKCLHNKHQRFQCKLPFQSIKRVPQGGERLGSIWPRIFSKGTCSMSCVPPFVLIYNVASPPSSGFTDVWALKDSFLISYCNCLIVLPWKRALTSPKNNFRLLHTIAWITTCLFRQLGK